MNQPWQSVVMPGVDVQLSRDRVQGWGPKLKSCGIPAEEEMDAELSPKRSLHRLQLKGFESLVAEVKHEWGPLVETAHPNV